MKTFLQMIILLLGIIMPQILFAQNEQDIPINDEQASKIIATIPDWKILKKRVYASIPYPDIITSGYWKSKREELQKTREEYNEMGIAAKRVIFTSMAWGAKGGEQSLKLKQEHEQLCIQLKSVELKKNKKLAVPYSGSLIDSLNIELQIRIEKKSTAIINDLKKKKALQFGTHKIVDQITIEESIAWFKENYIGDNCKGSRDAKDATSFLLNIYLPLAEKKIMLEHRLFGYDFSLRLKDLYLDALQEQIALRQLILQQMRSCFDIDEIL